jgi:YfdX protein
MNRKHLAVPAMASALALSLLAYQALAQAPSTAPEAATASAAPAKPGAEAKDWMKFSQNGNDAIREIAAARVAIFDGDPKLASDMITKAKASFAKAELEAPTFTVKATESVQGKELGTTSDTAKAAMVPVDGQLVVADDFVSTPEKQARIAKANEHFKNGEQKEGLEELRLGEVEVMYNRVWMPLASASAHIEQAIKLMNDQKYYEANLALKAIDDSLTVDSVSVTDLPKKKS